MPTKLILTDFDRTMFNLVAFFQDLISEISRQKLINEDGIIEARRRVANLDESLHIGQFFTDYNVSSEVVIDLASKTFGENKYIYPDVSDFIDKFSEQDCMILTTGEEWVQKLKLQISPIVEKIPRKILSINKGLYVKENLVLSEDGMQIPEINDKSYTELYVIDDNPVVLEYLLGISRIKLFHIYRDDGKYSYNVADPVGIIGINSLQEVA
jgi:hypothetical protein